MSNLITLYDSASRALQPLKAIDSEHYRFYCCGPTVYGPAHVGNFRTFVNVDVLYRVIRLAGLNPFYVRNITDVDDKTIRQSQAESLTLADFTAHWRDRFHADCDALGMIRPDIEPSAVDHIQEQIDMIATLVEKGHAYAAPDGSVYFKVASFPDYGSLSRLQEREITTEEVIHDGPVDADEYEGAAADFALWKATKPEDGENYWDSPWGKGRPGWHIECSAMSYKHLGAEFDLHAGGVDLIFPHHENEIAQSCASGCGPFAKHWFHGAHLMVDGGKMSKSLGNLYTLQDVLDRGYSAMALRYLLISGHYRKPLNFTFSSMESVVPALARLGKLEDGLRKVTGQDLNFDLNKAIGADFASFESAWLGLREDLNVPRALGAVFTAAKGLESALRKNEMAPDQAAKEWLGLQAILYALGLTVEAPVEEPKADIPESIQALATARWEAKQNKEWAEADRLRAELDEAGYVIKDSKDGFEVLGKS